MVTIDYCDVTSSYPRCEQADGWTGIEEELEKAGFVTDARVFSVFAIILGNFIFTQTVVAIILLNIDRATAKFKASSHSLASFYVLRPGVEQAMGKEGAANAPQITMQGGKTTSLPSHFSIASLRMVN